MSLLRIVPLAALLAVCLTGCQQLSHWLADKVWPM
jgi:hypothetical protein